MLDSHGSVPSQPDGEDMLRGRLAILVGIRLAIPNLFLAEKQEAAVGRAKAEAATEITGVKRAHEAERRASIAADAESSRERRAELMRLRARVTELERRGSTMADNVGKAAAKIGEAAQSVTAAASATTVEARRESEQSVLDTLAAADRELQQAKTWRGSIDLGSVSVMSGLVPSLPPSPAANQEEPAEPAAAAVAAVAAATTNHSNSNKKKDDEEDKAVQTDNAAAEAEKAAREKSVREQRLRLLLLTIQGSATALRLREAKVSGAFDRLRAAAYHGSLLAAQASTLVLGYRIMHASGARFRERSARQAVVAWTRATRAAERADHEAEIARLADWDAKQLRTEKADLHEEKQKMLADTRRAIKDAQDETRIRTARREQEQANLAAQAKAGLLRLQKELAEVRRERDTLLVSNQAMMSAPSSASAEEAPAAAVAAPAPPPADEVEAKDDGNTTSAAPTSTATEAPSSPSRAAPVNNPPRPLVAAPAPAVAAAEVSPALPDEESFGNVIDRVKLAAGTQAQRRGSLRASVDVGSMFKQGVAARRHGGAAAPGFSLDNQGGQLLQQQQEYGGGLLDSTEAATDDNTASEFRGEFSSADDGFNDDFLLGGAAPTGAGAAGAAAAATAATTSVQQPKADTSAIPETQEKPDDPPPVDKPAAAVPAPAPAPAKVEPAVAEPALQEPLKPEAPQEETKGPVAAAAGATTVPAATAIASTNASLPTETAPAAVVTLPPKADAAISPSGQVPLAAPEPSAGESTDEEEMAVKVSLTYDKDFDELMQGDPQERVAFEAEVVDNVADAAGVDAGDVTITGLRPGSVVVDLEIKKPKGDSRSLDSLAKDLHSSPALQAAKVAVSIQKSAAAQQPQQPQQEQKVPERQPLSNKLDRAAEAWPEDSALAGLSVGVIAGEELSLLLLSGQSELEEENADGSTTKRLSALDRARSPIAAGDRAGNDAEDLSPSEGDDMSVPMTINAGSVAAAGGAELEIAGGDGGGGSGSGRSGRSGRSGGGSDDDRCGAAAAAAAAAAATGGSVAVELQSGPTNEAEVSAPSDDASDDADIIVSPQTPQTTNAAMPAATKDPSDSQPYPSTSPAPQPGAKAEQAIASSSRSTSSEMQEVGDPAAALSDAAVAPRSRRSRDYTQSSLPPSDSADGEDISVPLTLGSVTGGGGLLSMGEEEGRRDLEFLSSAPSDVSDTDTKPGRGAGGRRGRGGRTAGDLQSLPSDSGGEDVSVPLSLEGSGGVPLAMGGIYRSRDLLVSSAASDSETDARGPPPTSAAVGQHGRRRAQRSGGGKTTQSLPSDDSGGEDVDVPLTLNREGGGLSMGVDTTAISSAASDSETDVAKAPLVQASRRGQHGLPASAGRSRGGGETQSLPSDESGGEDADVPLTLNGAGGVLSMGVDADAMSSAASDA